MMPTRRWVQGAGIRLQLFDSGGSGLPVMFLHGAMGRGVSWLPVIDVLAPKYRCLALDQRGHGRSDKPATGYDRESYVADLAAVIDDLGMERLALVGHSTGALNAWVYAARHPERVAAAVLEDMYATPRGPDNLEEWRQWLASWPLPFRSLSDVRRYFSALRPSLGDYFAELFEERDDGWRPLFSTDAILATIGGNDARSYAAELQRVECPALIVKGARSDLALDEAEKMRASMRRGRLAVIDGAYHTVHRDQPAAYIRVVERFLDEVTRESGAQPEWSEARLELLAREQYEHGDARFAIDAARTALIVIDMQREFATPDGGPFFVPEASRRVPAMRGLLETFRQLRLPVIHTAFAATHGGLDRPGFGALMPNRAAGAAMPPGLFERAEFVDELRPRPGEIVIEKPSYGAFYDTPLETILKRLRVETVVLAGTLTDCCVGTTARQAYERGFGAIVAEDATATSLPEMHEAELKGLRRAFARVRTVDEIRQELIAWTTNAESSEIGSPVLEAAIAGSISPRKTGG